MGQDRGEQRHWRRAAGQWQQWLGVPGLLLLAACASRPVPPVAVETAPPPARPVPPPHASADMTLPPRGSDGRYQTINSGIDPDEAVWHLRSALNVAALGCSDTAIIADYNKLLNQHRSALSKAHKQEGKRFGSGKSGQAAFDAHVTQVYNYFAQPPVQRSFCARAGAVARQALAVPDANGFPAFAATALGELEQPFQDFYAAYETYRIDLAAWQAGGGNAAAGSTPAAVAAVATMAAPHAAPAAAPATPAAQPLPAGAAWQIQLGAYSGDSAARSAWSQVTSRVGSLAAYQPHYEAAPGKKLVRLRVGPVSDRGAALQLCAAAAAAGLDCAPVRPAG